MFILWLCFVNHLFIKLLLTYLVDISTIPTKFLRPHPIPIGCNPIPMKFIHILLNQLCSILVLTS